MVEHRLKSPKVSIIMNCFNGERYLREAIDSVYAQTYQDWEIIFWDNASTDNSAEIAKRYDEKLRYFRGEKTVPIGHARNLALENTQGQFITFLDCDDIWLFSKLERQVLLMEENTDIDFLYANYYRFFERGKKKVLALKNKQPEGYVFERFLHHYPVATVTAMVRRSALQRLETLYDNKLRVSSDFDLFMRVLYKVKAGYIEEPLAIYRIHPEMDTVRLMDRFAEENAYVIEKIKAMDPLFEGKYASSLEYFNAALFYLRAKVEMVNKNKRSAREFVRPYIWNDYRFLVMYLLTYFPLFFFKLLSGLR
jgi:glycosyltransferase involved in cell wall biosynthesis